MVIGHPRILKRQQGSNPMIRVEHLTKVYDTGIVRFSPHDVNLGTKGEFLAVMGRRVRGNLRL